MGEKNLPELETSDIRFIDLFMAILEHHSLVRLLIKKGVITTREIVQSLDDLEPMLGAERLDTLISPDTSQDYREAIISYWRKLIEESKAEFLGTNPDSSGDTEFPEFIEPE